MCVCGVSVALYLCIGIYSRYRGVSTSASVGGGGSSLQRSFTFQTESPADDEKVEELEQSRHHFSSEISLSHLTSLSCESEDEDFVEAAELPPYHDQVESKLQVLLWNV